MSTTDEQRNPADPENFVCLTEGERLAFEAGFMAGWRQGIHNERRTRELLGADVLPFRRRSPKQNHNNGPDAA